VSKEVYLHKIPNARFAEMDAHVIIRIFFPFLNPREGKRNCVSDLRMSELYNHAVKPASLEVLPEELTRTWPGSYADEVFRAGGRSNYSDTAQARPKPREQSGREVHGRYLNQWVARIREYVQAKPELEWAKSFFFGVEMRGTKNREDSIHVPPGQCLCDAGECAGFLRGGPGSSVFSSLPHADGAIIDMDTPRVRAVEGVLKDFDTENFLPGHWYLDIATTITVSDNEEAPSECAFASARMHAEIIHHCTGASRESCHSWVDDRKSFYEKDEVAHLGDAAGFRFTYPHPVPAACGVHYVQVYSTDKSVTYRMDAASKAKRTSPLEVLADWDREREHHFLPLQQAFKESSRSHGVALRIESRVSFEFYPQVHIRIPDETIRLWLYRMTNSTFW
jgi:hypothetical protein